MFNDYGLIIVTLALLASGCGSGWVLNEVYNTVSKKDDIQRESKSHHIFYLCMALHIALFILLTHESFRALERGMDIIHLIVVMFIIVVCFAWTLNKYREFYISMLFNIKSTPNEEGEV
jgi:cytochrome bd-type quinol oxidase subunit 2